MLLNGDDDRIGALRFPEEDDLVSLLRYLVKRLKNLLPYLQYRFRYFAAYLVLGNKPVLPSVAKRDEFFAHAQS